MKIKVRPFENKKRLCYPHLQVNHRLMDACVGAAFVRTLRVVVAVVGFTPMEVCLDWYTQLMKWGTDFGSIN